MKQHAEPQYLAIGRITMPFGVQGEVKVAIHTGWPHRFALLEQVYIGDEAASQLQATKVERARLHKGQAILKLAACPDRDAAEVLRGQWLFVPRSEAVPTDEGEYYIYQIVGLEVWEGERHLGRVVEVLEMPAEANDVYVVRGPRGELLLPALRQVILKVDLEAGRMEVAVPPGLED
jgi:16S rRNA processing protein RimM